MPLGDRQPVEAAPARRARAADRADAAAPRGRRRRSGSSRARRSRPARRSSRSRRSPPTAPVRPLGVVAQLDPQAGARDLRPGVRLVPVHPARRRTRSGSRPSRRSRCGRRAGRAPRAAAAERPASATSRAAVTPAKPPPTTITSCFMRATMRASRPTAPSRADEERVDLDLGDLRVRGGEAATAPRRRARRPRRRAAGGRGRRSSGAEPSERMSCLGRRVVDGRERDRDVAEHLGVDPAARRPRRAARSAGRAGRRRAARIPPATSSAASTENDSGSSRRDDVVERRGELSLVAQAEHDAAGVRLVQEAERLEDDRVAELRGRGERLVPAAHACEPRRTGRRPPRAPHARRRSRVGQRRRRRGKRRQRRRSRRAVRDERCDRVYRRLDHAIDRHAAPRAAHAPAASSQYIVWTTSGFPLSRDRLREQLGDRHLAARASRPRACCSRRSTR